MIFCEGEFVDLGGVLVDGIFYVWMLCLGGFSLLDVNLLVILMESIIYLFFVINVDCFVLFLDFVVVDFLVLFVFSVLLDIMVC